MKQSSYLYNISSSIEGSIQALLSANKAKDITVINLKGKSDIADHMIIASGTSTRHIATLAEKVMQHLNSLDLHDHRHEGLKTCDWVIIDAHDVIIHLFKPEVRAHYKLEKMWQVDLPAHINDLEIM